MAIMLTEKPLPILPYLPSIRASDTDPIPSELIGATILAFGTTEENIEGGGLAIDYRINNETRRVVFGFTECGMWVEHAPIAIAIESQECSEMPRPR